MATDPATLARVEGRQLLGMRWVSHILQRITATHWKDKSVEKTVREAGRVYSARRSALVEALAEQGIASHGVSGFNVWVPVPEETGPIRAMLDAGYAIAAGERFRLTSGPGVRITTATLQPEEADAVAATLAAALRPGRGGSLV
jgi:DNA-binding transcriptional MocR family regulator